MTISTLYLYDQIHRLLYVPDVGYYNQNMDNAPMNKKFIKAHKGIKNILRFRVFSPERKPVGLCDKLIYARIIEEETKQIKLERRVVQSFTDGVFDLILDREDLYLLEAGYYTLVFLEASEFAKGITGNYTYTGLFTDFDSNIKTVLHVTEQAEHDPIKTYSVSHEQFVERLEYDSVDTIRYSKFITDAIVGPRLNNSVSNNITFSTITNNFYGKLSVYATLEHTPNPDISRGWSQVDIEDGVDYLQYDGYTGCQYFNMKGNYMWLKFVITPDEGTDFSQFVKLNVRT